MFRAAENRILRRPDDERMIKESGKYFEDFIDGTKKNNRAIVLIIDEAHSNVTPDLAQQIIDYIDPKLLFMLVLRQNQKWWLRPLI